MFTDKLDDICFIINAISENNSAYKRINKYIDASLENILYRIKSDFDIYNIAVLTYPMRDTFSKFDEEHSRTTTPA